MAPLTDTIRNSAATNSCREAAQLTQLTAKTHLCAPIARKLQKKLQTLTGLQTRMSANSSAQAFEQIESALQNDLVRPSLPCLKQNSFRQNLDMLVTEQLQTLTQHADMTSLQDTLDPLFKQLEKRLAQELSEDLLDLRDDLDFVSELAKLTFQRSRELNYLSKRIFGSLTQKLDRMPMAQRDEIKTTLQMIPCPDQLDILADDNQKSHFAITSNISQTRHAIAQKVSPTSRPKQAAKVMKLPKPNA